MTIRLLLLWCVALAVLVPTLKAETWYVRADGGTRWSPHAGSGQCDGKADAAYPGHGKKQHCAFNDVRYLWDDQHSYGELKWVIAGGDTVIIDNTKAWRIGWDTNGTRQGGDVWCSGFSGGPYGCSNPNIPAGTAAQHTRIVGRNYASCNVGDQPDKSKMTELFGGHGVGTVLNLNGAEYVDVECLNIARHSQCVTHGDPRLPGDCKRDVPLDDYDGDGMGTDVHTHDVLLQDLWIHGHTDRGIIGPIGGLVTANRVDISTNGMAGWDFDDGRGTASVNAVLKMTNSTIEWNGCNQEYPAVHPVPVVSCYGQSNGGYGDGIGTPGKDGMDVSIDHSMFRYNTQDGEDFGHIDTGTHKLSITNSLAYGNNGGQFKWGPAFTNVVFVNNIAVANCLRLSKPFPGAPAEYDAHLADFCRAEDGLSFEVYQGDTVLFDNNTIVSYSPTTLDIGCGSSSCSQTTFMFRNNIVLGYENPGTYDLGGKPGGPGGLYFDKPLGKFVRSHNLMYGVRNEHCGGTDICKDPQFKGEPRFKEESDLDNFDFHLAATSPARNAGVRIPEIHTDFAGKPRPTSGNYTIGALEQ